MRAELIFVGTELLLGQITNTNAPIALTSLAALGIEVYAQQTVGDNLGRLVQAIQQARQRAEIIILGGGLGPTEDDLTREALAAALSKELVEDSEAWEGIVAFFQGRGYPMPEANRKQALKPTGAVIISNPVGTAPGLWLEEGDHIFIALPGPPREFRFLWEQSVVPNLNTKVAGERQVIFSRVLRVCGKSEAGLDEELQDLLQGHNPTVAPLAQVAEVHVRLTAKAANEELALKLCEPVEAEIRRRFGWHLYGVDNERLEEVIGRQLAQEGLTLSTAESCTGGLLANRLTNVSGSSRYFHLGVVAYDNRQKVKLLGVDETVLEVEGAVSEEVAVAMAKGARQTGQTDVGIGITGIAGPTGASATKPVGLVHMALDFQGNIFTRKVKFWGEREQVKELSAQSALIMLWKVLAGKK